MRGRGRKARTGTTPKVAAGLSDLPEVEEDEGEKVVDGTGEEWLWVETGIT